VWIVLKYLQEAPESLLEFCFDDLLDTLIMQMQEFSHCCTAHYYSGSPWDGHLS